MFPAFASFLLIVSGGVLTYHTSSHARWYDPTSFEANDVKDNPRHKNLFCYHFHPSFVYDVFAKVHRTETPCII